MRAAASTYLETQGGETRAKHANVREMWGVERCIIQSQCHWLYVAKQYKRLHRVGAAQQHRGWSRLLPCTASCSQAIKRKTQEQSSLQEHLFQGSLPCSLTAKARNVVACWSCTIPLHLCLRAPCTGPQAVACAILGPGYATPVQVVEPAATTPAIHGWMCSRACKMATLLPTTHLLPAVVCCSRITLHHRRLRHAVVSPS